MSELIHNLGIDWKLLVAQIVNFAILLAVLKKFAYGPIMKMLNERQEKIENAIERSRQVDQKMQEIEVLKEHVLNDARIASQDIIKKAEAAAVRVQEEILAATHRQSEQLLAEAQKKVEAEREKIFADVRHDIAVLVASAVEKSVGDVIDERAQKQLVEQAVRALTTHAI